MLGFWDYVGLSYSLPQTKTARRSLRSCGFHCRAVAPSEGTSQLLDFHNTWLKALALASQNPITQTKCVCFPQQFQA